MAGEDGYDPSISGSEPEALPFGHSPIVFENGGAGGIRTLDNLRMSVSKTDALPVVPHPNYLVYPSEFESETPLLCSDDGFPSTSAS